MVLIGETSHGRNGVWGVKSAVVERHSGIPSGKRLHNYGKSQFLIGKSTVNGPFPIAALVYQRVIGPTRQNLDVVLQCSGYNLPKWIFSSEVRILDK